MATINFSVSGVWLKIEGDLEQCLVVSLIIEHTYDGLVIQEYLLNS